MPNGKYIRKTKEKKASQAEIEFCTSCPLPKCIAKEDGHCKLLRERFKKKGD